MLYAFAECRRGNFKPYLANRMWWPAVGQHSSLSFPDKPGTYSPNPKVGKAWLARGNSKGGESELRTWYRMYAATGSSSDCTITLWDKDVLKKSQCFSPKSILKSSRSLWVRKLRKLNLACDLGTLHRMQPKASSFVSCSGAFKDLIETLLLTILESKIRSAHLLRFLTIRQSHTRAWPFRSH